MAYHLTFFCRSDAENGSSALASFLSKLTEAGDRVLIKHNAFDYDDEVDVCELATDNGSGIPAAGWLVLNLAVGVEYNAEIVISASPNDEYGIWGSDLVAELILSGSPRTVSPAAAATGPGAQSASDPASSGTPARPSWPRTNSSRPARTGYFGHQYGNPQSPSSSA